MEGHSGDNVILFLCVFFQWILFSVQCTYPVEQQIERHTVCDPQCSSWSWQWNHIKCTPNPEKLETKIEFHLNLEGSLWIP